MMASPQRAENTTFKSVALAFLLWAGAFTIYLLTLSRNYSPDSMAFAQLVAGGKIRDLSFFKGEHLFYPGAGWLWYRLWRFLDYNGGPLYPLQVLNAFWGAAGVVFLFGSARLIFKKYANRLGLVAALTLAVSYAYWYHSTEAEDQIIANALALAAFLVLTIIITTKRSSFRLQVALALATILAILFHATHVLFLPSLFLGLWLVCRHWRQPLTFGFLSAIFVVIPYLAVGSLVLNLRSFAGYRDWLFSATEVGVWGEWKMTNFWWGIKTLANSIVDLRGGPNLRSLSQGNLEMGNILAILGFLAIMVVMASSLAQRTYDFARGRDRKISLVLFLWLIPYALFNLYWAPLDVQFWMALIPPLALIFADFLRRLPSVRGITLLMFLAPALLFVIQVDGTFLPRHDLSTNQGYAKALCLKENTQPADLIVAPGWDWAGSYVPYFAGRDLLSVTDVYLVSADHDRQRFWALLKERIDQTRARGGEVYVAHLFSLDKEERDWLYRATGLKAEDFLWKRDLAWSCGGEPIWEIRE
ncbi:MAG: DUF2723 domain-containing protein [Chloroflexi bacterium]|nr:DUF2723 domain-containing protein [Chloroflexota bacterium]